MFHADVLDILCGGDSEALPVDRVKIGLADVELSSHIGDCPLCLRMFKDLTSKLLKILHTAKAEIQIALLKMKVGGYQNEHFFSLQGHILIPIRIGTVIAQTDRTEECGDVRIVPEEIELQRRQPVVVQQGIEIALQMHPVMMQRHNTGIFMRCVWRDDENGSGKSVDCRLVQLQINLIKILRKDPIGKSPVCAIQRNSFRDISVVLVINNCKHLGLLPSMRITQLMEP